MRTHHLAQINIGRLLAPLDHPQIAGFVAQLQPINALADASPGFIWRLQSDTGNATGIPYDLDPTMIVNMSVWDSVESLRAYTYQSQHLQVFRQRQQWFQKLDGPHYCLWWIPIGHIPTVAEGRAKLEHYRLHGSTPESFWFPELQPEPSTIPASHP